MEDLTKQQLILLALLVSFVTSIATGIATVSLIEQAPEGVKTPVFQVIERTVERVVPEEVLVPGAVRTEEKTVIVKEEDAITGAIEQISKSMVRVYEVELNRNDIVLERSFVGIGVLVAGAGLVSSADAVVQSNDERYEIVFPDGTRAVVPVLSRDEIRGFTTFSLDATLGEKLTIATSVDRDSVRLGQTVLGLGGENTTTVALGIVSGLVTNEAGAVTHVTTNFFSGTSGAPAVNLFGEIVGFAPTEGTNNFIPAYAPLEA
jgi:hypothetical protein